MASEPVDDHDGVEEELLEQLKQQKEALAEVQEAVMALGEEGEETEDGLELRAMKAQLLESTKEIETALLEFKRSRLLRMVAASEQVARVASAASETEERTETGLAPGTTCRFRYTDGRWYWGRVESNSGRTTSVHFLHPSRTFMLEAASIPQELVHASTGPAVLEAKRLLPGTRLFALHPASSLWQPAELQAADAASRTFSVVFTEDGAQTTASASDLAMTLHAQDPEAAPDSSAGSRAKGYGPPSPLEREACGSSGGEDEAGDSGEDGTDTDAGAEEEEEEEEEDEQEAAGSVGFARCAISTSSGGGNGGGGGGGGDTVLFAQWEEHTRGVASRMMAGMGYRKGSGLGVAADGVVAPLEVIMLPQKSGLGAAKAQKEGGRKGKKRKNRRERGRHRAWQKRQAARDAEVAVEEQKPGLFDFINNSLGDGSEAAAVRRSLHGQALARGQRSSMQVSARAAAPLRAQAPAAAADTRGAMLQQQQLLRELQSQERRLAAMLKRNEGNRDLKVQITRKLGQVRSQLAGAEAELLRMEGAVRTKEQGSKWMKF